MKCKKCLLNLLLALFLLITYSSVYSQNDTLTSTNIYYKTKPLQFGNEFLLTDQVDVPENTPDYFVISGSAMDYIHNRMTYDPIRDPKRLGLNTALYLGGTAVAFAILWVSPESFSGWDKDEIRGEGLIKQWKRNVRAGPVWDQDDWFLNWVTHPYAGAIYYMSARGSGYRWWESFFYSAIMSTFFWEYGVEAFAEIPSWQDLFITPFVGSAIGELFFVAKGAIVRNDRRILSSKFLGIASLIVMDPMNELLNVMGYKTKNKIQAYSLIGPIDFDPVSQKRIWGLQVAVQF
jgi:hypothetical protein